MLQDCIINTLTYVTGLYYKYTQTMTEVEKNASLCITLSTTDVSPDSSTTQCILILLFCSFLHSQ